MDKLLEGKQFCHISHLFFTSYLNGGLLIKETKCSSRQMLFPGKQQEVQIVLLFVKMAESRRRASDKKGNEDN